MRHFLLCTALLALICAAGAQTGTECHDIPNPECTDYADCALCQMKTTWAKVAFCTSQAVADTLPGEYKLSPRGSLHLETIFSFFL